MAELISMMNIGKEMAGKLDSVGIGSAEELVHSGAEQAFLKLKERYPNVCLVHLYALEGAVRNVEFNSLPEERKKELKEFSDFFFFFRGARLDHEWLNVKVKNKEESSTKTASRYGNDEGLLAPTPSLWT